jgi:hypothetical protein
MYSLLNDCTNPPSLLLPASFLCCSFLLPAGVGHRPGTRRFVVGDGEFVGRCPRRHDGQCDVLRTGVGGVQPRLQRRRRAVEDRAAQNVGRVPVLRRVQTSSGG